MYQQERVHADLNEWFYHDFDLTELGFLAISLSPGLEESWKLLGIDKSQENVPILMKKCMEYSLLDDETLNYLFPEIGSVIFRITMQYAIGSVCSSTKGNELILDLEQERFPDNPDPYIFYMPIGPIKNDYAY